MARSAPPSPPHGLERCRNQMKPTDPALHPQAIRPGVCCRCWIRRWKRSSKSRAAVRPGAAAPIIAIILATAFDSVSRSAVIMRAMWRADGVLLGRLSRVAVPSSFRCLVAHSVTILRLPVKPLVFLTRHSAAPLWLPSAHAVSSCARNGSSEFILMRNISACPPRTTWRTSPRDLLARRMISLIASP